MKHLIRSKKLLLTAAALLVTASAQAQLLINVDFNGGQFGSPVGPTQSGSAVIGTGGDYWNGFASPSVGSGDIYGSDFDGSQAAIAQISYRADGGYTSTNNAFSASYFGGYVNSNYAPLMGDWFASYSNTTASTITLTGLPINTPFQLYLYSESDSSGRPVTFSATGASGSITVNPNNNLGTFVQAPVSDPNAASNYGVLSPTSDATGTLVISFLEAANSEGDINGFQLQQLNAVPEPSTVATIVLAGAGAVAAAWKRRRSNR